MRRSRKLVKGSDQGALAGPLKPKILLASFPLQDYATIPELVANLSNRMEIRTNHKNVRRGLKHLIGLGVLDVKAGISSGPAHYRLKRDSSAYYKLLGISQEPVRVI